MSGTDRTRDVAGIRDRLIYGPWTVPEFFYLLTHLRVLRSVVGTELEGERRTGKMTDLQEGV